MKAAFPSRTFGRARRGFGREDASRAERLLRCIGADPDLVDAVLGDLAEECASRTERDGDRAARWWYLREALRSTPHLLWNAISQASWRRRAGVAMGFGMLAVAVTVTVTKMVEGTDAPARLVAVGALEGGIVVNNERPIRLTMRVLDASGRGVTDTGVHFRWVSGAPIPVTARGAATCTRPGDAIVQASLGPLTTPLLLRCRPVRKVSGPGMVNIVAGGPAAEVPFVALDATGQPVTMLRGEITITDSSVATLDVGADGSRRVRGRVAGRTTLRIRVGDREGYIGVHVYRRASSLEAIRPGQELAIPVTLGGGDVHQWRLPAAREEYLIRLLTDGDEQFAPGLTIVGANCAAVLDGHSFFCVAQRDASLFIFHPREGDQSRTVRGMLTVSRLSEP